VVFIRSFVTGLGKNPLQGGDLLYPDYRQKQSGSPVPVWISPYPDHWMIGFDTDNDCSRFFEFPLAARQMYQIILP